MSSPVFGAMGNTTGGMIGGPFRMIQQFIQFAKDFKGNPQEEVQKLLQSGQMSQDQLNALQQQATQFQQLLGQFPGANNSR